MLRSCPETVRRLVRAGLLPCVKVGRRYLFDETWVHAYLEATGPALPAHEVPTPQLRSVRHSDTGSAQPRAASMPLAGVLNRSELRKRERADRGLEPPQAA